MKIKVILLTFFIYISYFSPLWGQTTGKITDTKQQPIEGATIVMQLPDSTYLGAAISAADGTFTLEQEPDSYLLIIQHLLYQTRLTKGKTTDAGIITLEAKDYNLEEVVIKGEKPLVKVEDGRLGYDLSVLSEKASCKQCLRSHNQTAGRTGKERNAFSCRS